MKTLLTLTLVFLAYTSGYSQIKVKTTRDTHILKERNQATFNNPLIIASAGETLNLVGYYDEYFTVTHGNDTGYVYYPYVEERTPEITRFKKDQSEAYKRWLEESGFKSESERIAANRLSRYINKFGADAGRKVYHKMIWIGMTDEMAKSSIGSPESVNSTKTSGGERKQWVYPNKYLYFDNGVLTAIQEQK